MAAGEAINHHLFPSSDKLVYCKEGPGQGMSLDEPDDGGWGGGWGGDKKAPLTPKRSFV